MDEAVRLEIQKLNVELGKNQQVVGDVAKFLEEFVDITTEIKMLMDKSSKSANKIEKIEDFLNDRLGNKISELSSRIITTHLNTDEARNRLVHTIKSYVESTESMERIAAIADDRVEVFHRKFMLKATATVVTAIASVLLALAGGVYQWFN